MPNNVSVGVAFSDPALSGATIDNSVTSTRLYSNSDGSTTWVAVTTAS